MIQPHYQGIVGCAGTQLPLAKAPESLVSFRITSAKAVRDSATPAAIICCSETYLKPGGKSKKDS
jgi:hypothetical protein